MGVEDQVPVVQVRWSEVAEPVHATDFRMKKATTVYEEFKTLVAQFDRLEKLRRSSKCAAETEKLSEKLDDLENCPEGSLRLLVEIL